MSSHELFLQDKKLRAWWSKIVDDPQFDQVMLYASATALEGCPSEEQRGGVIKFKDILENLCEEEPANIAFPRPKLSHDLDVHRRNIADEKPEKPKKNNP